MAKPFAVIKYSSTTKIIPDFFNIDAKITQFTIAAYQPETKKHPDYRMLLLSV